jgi:hypothetical protein
MPLGIVIPNAKQVWALYRKACIDGIWILKQRQMAVMFADSYLR